MITLTTAAKDNHGYSYTVQLLKRHDGHVLLFGAARGGWLAEEMAESFRSEWLAFDLGKDWYCTNIQDVLREVRSVLSK